MRQLLASIGDDWLDRLVRSLPGAAQNNDTALGMRRLMDDVTVMIEDDDDDASATELLTAIEHRIGDVFESTAVYVFLCDNVIAAHMCNTQPVHDYGRCMTGHGLGALAFVNNAIVASTAREVAAFVDTMRTVRHTLGESYLLLCITTMQHN